MNQRVSIYTRLNQISAVCVVLSYFFIWHKSWFSSEIGFKLLSDALKGIKDANGDNVLLGLGVILFVASPIVCHAINLYTSLMHQDKKLSFILSLIPASIWIFIALLLLAKSKGDTLILKMFFPHEIGASLSMAGMACGLIFSWFDYQSILGTKVTLDESTKSHPPIQKIKVFAVIIAVSIAAMFLFFVLSPSAGVEGQLNCVPPSAASKGIRIKAVNVASGSVKTTTSDSSGHFFIKGLPLNSNIRLSVDDPDFISDSIDVFTGNETKNVSVSQLSVLQRGPKGAEAWLFDGNATVTLNANPLYHWYLSPGNGSVFGYYKHQLQAWYSNLPANWSVPSVSRGSWIVAESSDDLVLALMTYSDSKIATLEGYNINVPSGWFVGIKDISIDQANGASFVEAYQKDFSSRIQVGRYQAFRLDVLPGRWAVVERKLVGASQRTNIFPSGEPQWKGWAIDVK